MKHTLLSIVLCTLMGCAAMLPAPMDEITKLPVVRVGDQAPQSGEYVVFYPAGFPFPAKFIISGSLFASEKQIDSGYTRQRFISLQILGKPRRQVMDELS